MSVMTFGLVDEAEACSLSAAAPWVQPLEKVVRRAPEIVVVQIDSKKDVGGDRFDYSGKVVKTLKGTRQIGETVTVTLKSEHKFADKDFYYMKSPDCETVGGLVLQHYVILMPGQDNENAIIEVSSPDDAKVAQITKLSRGQRGR